MRSADALVIELSAFELLTLRDSLLYFSEFASDDLHGLKAKVAGDLRAKLLSSFIEEVAKS